jgi:hypothetical protein
MHKNRAILVHWPCWSLLSTESFKNNRTEQAILSPRAIYLARSDICAHLPLRTSMTFGI